MIIISKFENNGYRHKVLQRNEACSGVDILVPWGWIVAVVEVDRCVYLSLHVTLHEHNLRGIWDNLSCCLYLKESIPCVSSQVGHIHETNIILVVNILIRLNFDSKRFDSHDMNLAKNALQTGDNNVWIYFAALFLINTVISVYFTCEQC